MPFLGIDQSLRATGICLLSEQGDLIRLETLDPGVLRKEARLSFIKQRVSSLLSDNVQFAAFEAYAYDSVSQHFSLGEIGGVLKLLAYEHGIPFVTVAPIALKKFATGNVHASKDDMCSAAKRLGLTPADDNQADAFFLASIAQHLWLETKPKVRAQLEVLQHLKQPPKPKRQRRVRRMLKNAL